MRLLVCGDRKWADGLAIRRVLEKWLAVQLSKGDKQNTVIQGDAPGADGFAKHWAENKGLLCLSFPAEWARFGKGAGPIRNKKMLLVGKPEMVFAFHANIFKSKGTKDMIEQAEAAGVPVRLFGKGGQELLELQDTREERRWQRA